MSERDEKVRDLMQKIMGRVASSSGCASSAHRLLDMLLCRLMRPPGVEAGLEQVEELLGNALNQIRAAKAIAPELDRLVLESKDWKGTT